MHKLAVLVLTGTLFLAYGAYARAAEAPVPEDDVFTYRFYGHLRVMGAVVQNDPQVEFVGRNDGFALQSARLGVDAEYKGRVRFRISADGAEDERDGPNAVNGRLRFALKDAYADVLMHPAAYLRAGQFYSVFDLEEVTSETDRVFVDRALPSRGVRPTQGWETPGLRMGRSLGVALRGPKVLGGPRWALGYEVAVQNGTAENISANDNDALAYTASVYATLPAQSLLFVAVRHNQRTEGELPLRHTEQDIAAAAGARLRLGPASVAGQFSARQTSFPTTGAAVENAWGAHGEVSWKFSARRFSIEPAYRFGILEPSDLIPNDLVQEHTVGLNLGLPQLHTRLLFDFTHVQEEAGRVLDNDRAEGLVEVSF